MDIGIPMFVGIVGASAVFFWMRSYFAPVDAPPRDLGVNASHPIGTVAAPVSSAAAQIPLPRATIASLEVSNLPGDWSSFRGPQRDDIGPPGSVVSNSIDQVTPVWQATVGDGYAAACVKNGRVYLLDHDSSTEQDVLRCFSLADGREVWRTGYSAVIKRNHGISRTIPATDGKSVVSIGPKCMVLCADALSGKPKWQTDLVEKFGVTVPEWYAGQCPLIDGRNVILATGGSSLFAALDLETGKVIWTTPNPRNWNMTHSSIAPAVVDGVNQYIACFSGGVAAVAASDGKLLWDTDKWTVNTATIPTPLPIGDGRIFLCGGYNSGALMIRVSKGDPRWSVTEKFRLTPDVFGSDQQTPILFKDHIYGVRPGGELVCLDLNGKPSWTSGTRGRFGTGPYLIADGKIVVLNDQGTLTLAEAGDRAYQPLGSKQVLKGPEAWGPMAIAGDRLLVRDDSTLECLRMGKP